MSKKIKEVDVVNISEKVRAYLQDTYNLAVKAHETDDATLKDFLLEDIIGNLGFLLANCSEC